MLESEGYGFLTSQQPWSRDFHKETLVFDHFYKAYLQKKCNIGWSVVSNRAPVGQKLLLT